MLEYEVMKSPDGLIRSGSALRFLGPEPAMGVSRCDLQKRLGRWLVNQHAAQWRALGDTQRQAQELILGPSLGAMATFFDLQQDSIQGCNWSSYGS